MITQFKSRVHSAELDDSIEVIVCITHAYLGRNATRFEPADDAELELEVYQEKGGENLWPKLEHDEQCVLVDQAFEHLKAA